MEKVYIVGAKRTPLGKFGGALAQTNAVTLGATAIKAAVTQAEFPDNVTVDQVLMGNVLQAGLGQNPARQASQLAGLGDAVPAITINDVCGSGLSSINLAASLIQSGQAQVVVAGGMESMSQAPYVLDQARFGYRLGHGEVRDTILVDALTDANEDIHMGITAENVADQAGITRATMDEFALASQAKALAAIDAGLFADEIVPVPVTTRTGTEMVTEDEGPRRGLSLEKLAKLKPAFKPDGQVTAGNASGINDGAAAVVLVSETMVREHGLTPMAEWVDASLIGLDPKVMGLGPYHAVEKLMAQHPELTLDDINRFELNEAFAAQAVAVNDQLGLGGDARVNPTGGAVALGHPVGASGARVLVTLLYGMQRDDQQYGVASLCIGGGMGVAALIAR